MATAGEIYYEHKEIINATLITAAAVTVTVATCGAGTALAVGAMSVGGGIVMGATSKDGFEKGFARGMADTSVALASSASNPGGAILGFGGQVIADCINHKVSSPEAYASACLGGAISNSGIMFGNTLSGVAGSVTNDLLSNSVAGGNISGRQMLKNAGIAGAIGFAFDAGVGFGKSFVPGYIKSGLDSILHPFNFGRVVDGRNILSIIDDFGRAAFGLNGGSNIIVNYLDAYLTGEALDCGQ